MIRVKICGVTSYDDAYAAAQAGADMIGFNFFKRSPRYIEPNAARAISDKLRAALGVQCPVLVGVFVNDMVGHISATMDKVGLDFVQLSGEESEELLAELKGVGFKSIQPMNKAQAVEDIIYYRPMLPTDERIPSILLDAHHPSLRGGTGEQVSLELALAVKEQVPRLMLAGGLNPENVADKIRAIQPWGVDVASGVEIADMPGRKDHVKVAAFIEAVLGAMYSA